MHYFCIFRVRQHYTNQITVGSNWIYSPLIVGYLNHVHLFLGFAYSFNIGIFLRINGNFSRMVSWRFLCNKTDSHSFIPRLNWVFWFSFEALYFWTETARHVYIFIADLDIFLISRIIASWTSVGRNYIESWSFKSWAVKRSSCFYLWFVDEIIVSRTGRWIDLGNLCLFFCFSEDKGHYRYYYLQ